MSQLNCETCEYLTQCEKEFGKISDHGDDCTSVIGTHFCLASWKSGEIFNAKK